MLLLLEDFQLDAEKEECKWTSLEGQLSGLLNLQCGNPKGSLCEPPLKDISLRVQQPK